MPCRAAFWKMMIFSGNSNKRFAKDEQCMHIPEHDKQLLTCHCCYRYGLPEPKFRLASAPFTDPYAFISNGYNKSHFPHLNGSSSHTIPTHLSSQSRSQQLPNLSVSTSLSPSPSSLSSPSSSSSSQLPSPSAPS